MKNRLVILLAMCFFAWTNREAVFWSYDLPEQAVCIVMLLLSCLPAARWVSGGMKYLPVFEIYCLMHALYYAFPYMEGRTQFTMYPQPVRVQSGILVCVFLLVAQLIYYQRLRRDRIASKVGGQWLTRCVPTLWESRVFWVLLFAWVMFSMVLVLGLAPDLGSSFNMVRTVFRSAGAIAGFYLFQMMGRGKMTTHQKAALLFGFGGGVFLEFTGGFLVGGTILGLNAMLAYALGCRRLPVLTAVLFLVIINFLHVGKAEMRNRFWNHPGNLAEGANNPIAVFSYWGEASWQRTFSGQPEPRETTSIIQRASLAHMLCLAVEATPRSLPFLNGQTYQQIFALLIPRFFWPEKPRGNLPSETLCIYYGVQTSKATDYTSIGFGHIAEGWANFGWVGVVLSGAFFGLLLSIPSRLTRVLPIHSFGYLLMLSVVPWAFNLENAVGTWLVSMFQSVVVAVVVLMILSQPVRETGKRPAPFPRRSAKFLSSRGPVVP